jgi:hypothetical protein
MSNDHAKRTSGCWLNALVGVVYFFAVWFAAQGLAKIAVAQGWSEVILEPLWLVFGIVVTVGVFFLWRLLRDPRNSA